MEERSGAYHKEPEESGFDIMAEAASKVKEDVERLVEGVDLNTITKKVEEFGRENPVGLALVAVTVGLAVGLLMRAPRRIAG